MLGYEQSLSSFSKGNFLRKCLLATSSFSKATSRDLADAQKPLLQSPPGNHLAAEVLVGTERWCELVQVHSIGYKPWEDLHTHLPPLFLP